MGKEEMDAKELSAEELAEVDGGTIIQTTDDSTFLYGLGLMSEKFIPGEAYFGWDKVSKSVEAGWAKVGITNVTHPWSSQDNEYWYNGQQISKERAYEIAKAGR